MTTASVKVSTKGQVVIPAELRKRYKVRAGARVEVRDEGGRIVIFHPAWDPVKGARGTLKGRDSLVDFLFAMRRSDLAHERRLLSRR